jgi:hypothetical protein
MRYKALAISLINDSENAGPCGAVRDCSISCDVLRCGANKLVSVRHNSLLYLLTPRP